MASQLPTLSKIRPPSAGRPSSQGQGHATGQGQVPRSASPVSGIRPPGQGHSSQGQGQIPRSSSPGTGIPTGIAKSTKSGIPSPGTGLPTKPGSGVSPNTGIPKRDSPSGIPSGVPGKSGVKSGIPSKNAGSSRIPGSLSGSAVSFSISASGIVPESIQTTEITKSSSECASGISQESGIPQDNGIPIEDNVNAEQDNGISNHDNGNTSEEILPEHIEILESVPSVTFPSSKSLSQIASNTPLQLEPLSERHARSQLELNSAEAETIDIEAFKNETESTELDNETMAERGIAVGDRVTISGVKFGIVRYFGRVHFADGVWCGVELSEPEGKHNGTIEGVMYFNVPENYGIFAPMERIQLATQAAETLESVMETSITSLGSLNSPKSPRNPGGNFGFSKSKLPAPKIRSEKHETSPGDIPQPTRSKLPKFSSSIPKSSKPDDTNLRPSKLPGLTKRTPTTPEESKIPSLPTKSLNRTFVKEDMNQTFTLTNVPDLLTPSPASGGGQMPIEKESLQEERSCPLDLPNNNVDKSMDLSMDTSVEFQGPEDFQGGNFPDLQTSTPLVRRCKSDLDSGVSESEEMAGSEDMVRSSTDVASSEDMVIESPETKLNATITFEEGRGRPLSIISTSSIDTGYQPDTDSEMGTLTVNSPSDHHHGNRQISPGNHGDGGCHGNEQTELQKAYIETFKDYQRGLRAGMARDQQRQLAADSDTDARSDARTLHVESETEKEISSCDDEISKDSLADDFVPGERTDSDDDIDLDSINIPELITPTSSLPIPTIPSPTTPKNLLPSNPQVTMATDIRMTTMQTIEENGNVTMETDATMGSIENLDTKVALETTSNGSIAPSPCDSLEPDSIPVVMETSKTESEIMDVSMDTVLKECEGLTDMADLTLVDGSMNESQPDKILNFTIDLDEPSVALSPVRDLDPGPGVKDEGHAEVTEVRQPSLSREDGLDDTQSSTHDTSTPDVSTQPVAGTLDTQIPDTPPQSTPTINVTLDDVDRIIDATIPLDGQSTDADVTTHSDVIMDVTASDILDVTPSEETGNATFDAGKEIVSQDNSTAERSSKESTPSTENSEAKAKGGQKKPVVKKAVVNVVEHKKPNLTKVRSSLADYINTPPPKPKPKPKETPPPPPPKKKVESKSPTPERQRKNSVTKIEKEVPKVKRTTPKSKWDSIMSGINTSKTTTPKPKTEVKSKLFEPTVASAASQPKVSKIEKMNMKNDAKNLQSRRLSLDSSKGRLPTTTDKRKMSLRPEELSRDLGNVSQRSSRTDLRPIGEESSRLEKPGNRSASSLRRAGSPSHSVKSESQLSVSAASHISSQSSRTGGKLAVGKAGAGDASRRTSIAGTRTAAAPPKPPARRTSLVAKKVADNTKKPATETPKIEPKKSSAAKPVSQVKGHQPDLVSNSIGSRAHAAQEISRLEALCEARTKELTFAKMQIKSASQGFDAMSVIVQYLSDDMNAFQSPELKKRLITAEKKITSLLLDLDDLRCEKSRIESLMHDLIQSHKEAVEAMRADHRAQIGAAEERVSKKQHDDLQKVIDQHTEEVKTLKSYHEKRFKELEDRSERLGEETRRKHARQLKDLAESDERHLSELQKQHEIKLEDITKRFEEIKCTLHDKVYSLKAECDELRNRSQMYEQALQQDTDFQVQKPESEESEAVKSIKIPKGPPGTPLRGALGSPLRGSPLRGSPMRGDERRPLSWSFHGDSASAAYLECVESLKQFDKELALAPYRDLPQEIDSLRAVLEMRNAEIHELRQSKAELEKQLTELPSAREKIISLEQKIENLEAIVSMKQDYEKQLVEKHQMLLRRYDKESKANKRLSMDNEELMYRLNETEDLLLSPSPDGGPPGGLPRQTSLDLDPQILNQKRTGVSPVTTPDILARRGFCRSPHDGAAVMRRVRTSSTSSSDDKRSSTISMRSETGENS